MISCSQRRRSCHSRSRFRPGRIRAIVVTSGAARALKGSLQPRHLQSHDTAPDHCLSNRRPASLCAACVQQSRTATYITRDDWPQVEGIGRLADREESRRLQDGEFRDAPERHAGVSARKTGTLEVPGGSELNDHQGGWLSGAVLSPEFGHLRLGHGGRPSIRGWSTR